jgi:hypothetical protein
MKSSTAKDKEKDKKPAGGGASASSTSGVSSSANVSLPKVASANGNSKAPAAAGISASKNKEDNNKKSASHKQGKAAETSLPKIAQTKDRPNSAGLLNSATENLSKLDPQEVPAMTATDSTSVTTALEQATIAGEAPSDSDGGPSVVAPAVTALETEEVEEMPAVNINGNVTLIYEMYNEQFPIVQGSTTAVNIDEVYCLSFVMPNCVIKLSPSPPTEKRRLQAEGSDLLQFFIFEEPPGTYQGLVADATYYVYVEQQADQLARDQARMKAIAASMDGVKKDTERAEGCSCIYGNPCIDQYICKDWDNRYAVATKNGWKGF